MCKALHRPPKYRDAHESDVSELRQQNRHGLRPQGFEPRGVLPVSSLYTHALKYNFNLQQNYGDCDGE